MIYRCCYSDVKRGIMKQLLEESLPIHMDDFTIRSFEREDLERLFNWPDYEGQYSMFNSSIKKLSFDEREKRWRKRDPNSNVLTLAVDHKDQKTIGKYSLIMDEVNSSIISNMGIRMKPDFCNKGYGTEIFSTIKEWCFLNGIESLGLDVLETNRRAIVCYEKVGLKVVKRYVKYDAYFVDMIALNKLLDNR